jgi:hypothetical protein
MPIYVMVVTGLKQSQDVLYKTLFVAHTCVRTFNMEG